MATKKHVLLGITILTSMTGMAKNHMEDDVLPNDTVLSLQEVVVRGNFSDERHAALNLTTLRPADILRHSTAPNYLEMMQGVPGVFATSSTGTYGDATLNMRGFKQENISILLNGIPIQGLTSGSMYWSNWMGLADATYAVQIQKGLGASMLADTSMGGAVNIITKRSGYSPMTNFGFSATEFGTLKGSLNYSSGELLGASLIAGCVETVVYQIGIKGRSQSHTLWKDSSQAVSTHSMEGFIPPVVWLNTQSLHRLGIIFHQAQFLLQGELLQQLLCPFSRRTFCIFCFYLCLHR